jgi:hypothetical protein
VAAAAVIAMFFGLGTWLVASQDNDDAGDSSATAALDRDSFDAKGPLSASGTTAGGSRESAGIQPQTGAPTTQSAKIRPNYLGAFADDNTLRQALIRVGEATPPTVTTTLPAATSAAGDTASCGRTDPADASIYTAELQGRPVTIVVTAGVATVFDDATCEPTTALTLTTG